LRVGLNFWRVYLLVIMISITLLLILLATREILGSWAISRLYQSVIEMESAHPLESADQMRALNDLVNDARETHLTFRAFWLQSATLILLNLLLPIGTALLGYIFGYERGQSDQSGSSENY
jgi:hypothetical protein